MTKPWTVLVAALLAILALFAPAPVAHADIFQWQYINLANPSLGKQQSMVLVPDGAGANVEPAANLSNRNLTMAYLIGADLSPTPVYDYVWEQGYVLVGYDGTRLYGANLSQADLTNANLTYAWLANANLSGAEVRGATFSLTSAYSAGSGLTPAQLYSTASYQAHDLTGINLNENSLDSVNLAAQNLTNASFVAASLAAANFSQANLTNAFFGSARLTGANLTGAVVRGANFANGITAAQLYSTASYQAHDLIGINLDANSLPGVNLAGQNLTNASFNFATLTGADFHQANLANASFSFAGTTLTNANFSQTNLTSANFSYAVLTGANLSGAEVRGADFYRNADYGTGIAAAQLYSTASYQAHDLAGIKLGGNNLAGINFAGQNLTNAHFSYATLTSANLSGSNLTNAQFYNATLSGANLTGADVRGAHDFVASTPNTSNLIQPNGHIAGLDLTAGASLVVRDYDGNPNLTTGPLPITVDQHLAMDATGKLQLVFDADPWDSTISFAPGIPVTRGGTLELTFAPDVNITSQIGRTIDLFGWSGVTPTGTFNVSSPYSWNLSNLYTTGEVTLTTVAGFVPGDFNGNGTVDAADYVVWRKSIGTQAAYEIWRSHFDEKTGSSSAASANAVVPEPATMVLLAFGAMAFGGRRVRRITSGLCLLATLSLSTRAHAVPQYVLTDLGVAGADNSLGWGINSTGQVTGYASSTVPADDTVTGFVWKPTTPHEPTGTLHSLGVLGGNFSWGIGINASGQVSGVGTTADETSEHATLWKPATPNGTSGTTYDLGTLGGTFSQGTGINDSGQLTGYSDLTDDAQSHAIIWKPIALNGVSGAMHDLGTLGGMMSFGWDVNASGQVTGEADANVETHAFLWKPSTPNGIVGTMHDLGTLGGSWSSGSGINDSGQIAGSSSNNDEVSRAFLWTPANVGDVTGTMLDLGTLGGSESYGYAVNAAGQAVGLSYVQAEVSNYSHAFLYTAESGMIDLNTMIDPLSGWELTDAADINDAGQITGQGLIGGQYHAYLLTPIRIPGDFNHDGFVDAADYVLWRKTGEIPAAYNDWRANFGRTLGSGAGVPVNSAVPEPAMLVMLIFATAGLWARRGRPHR